MKKLEKVAREQREIGAAHRVHQALHPQVRVVEAAAVEALEVVVVGEAGVDVRVAEGAVLPLVVGVGAEVASAPSCTRPLIDVARPERIPLHVVGADRSAGAARPRGVKVPPKRVAEIFFESPSTPVRGTDGALRLQVAVVEDDRTRCARRRSTRADRSPVAARILQVSLTVAVARGEAPSAHRRADGPRRTPARLFDAAAAPRSATDGVVSTTMSS